MFSNSAKSTDQHKLAKNSTDICLLTRPAVIEDVGGLDVAEAEADPVTDQVLIGAISRFYSDPSIIRESLRNKIANRQVTLLLTIIRWTK